MQGDVVGAMAGLAPSFCVGWSGQWRWFEGVFQAEVKRSSCLSRRGEGVLAEEEQDCGHSTARTAQSVGGAMRAAVA
jgi:hypothetical protein